MYVGKKKKKGRGSRWFLPRRPQTSGDIAPTPPILHHHPATLAPTPPILHHHPATLAPTPPIWLCSGEDLKPSLLGDFLEVERRLGEDSVFGGEAAVNMTESDRDGGGTLFADGRVLPPPRT
ncbi:hypothetical protein SSX86_007547 [Deinandra increscens subsp. villosa]|uniref:Uncharacterized protein n=1 Tax=Deinandra increscens subsp. villosa TaxID=3103831 RepID=A0AAP0DLI2_9ASTR